MNRSATAVLASALLLSAPATVAVDAAIDGPRGQRVRLAEASRVLTLQPGESADFSSGCAEDEAVTGGSQTSWPAGVKAVRSNLYWNGVISGWTIEFKNTTRAPITGQVSVGALCVSPGYIVTE